MFIDSSLIINKKKLEGIENDITCPICQGIINNPYFCNKCQNNFCYTCITKWMSINNKCPFKCQEPEYINNKFLKRIFSELLKFKCEKGCKEIISYEDINTHNEKCIIKDDYKNKYLETATELEGMKNYNKDILIKLHIEKLKNKFILKNFDKEKEDHKELKKKISYLEQKNFNLEDELNKLKKQLYDLEDNYYNININIKNENENLDDNIINEIYNKNKELENEIKKLKNKINEEIEKKNFLK